MSAVPLERVLIDVKLFDFRVVAVLIGQMQVFHCGPMDQDSFVQNQSVVQDIKLLGVKFLEIGRPRTAQ